MYIAINIYLNSSFSPLSLFLSSSPSPPPPPSALNPLLFQLASKGSPTVAKSAVLCLLSVFPESVSCLERLYEVHAHSLPH